MSELPESWSISTIGSVSAISTGTTPPTKDITNYGGDIPFVKPGDLDARDAISITEPQLSDIGAARARIVRKGAVLVSCIGNLGKVGVAGRPLATNQQINTVEFNESVVIDRFGYHYCKTLKPWLEHESSATTISIINKSKFSEAPIVIPPLPEQKRIADKLDTLLARIDACHDRLDRLPTIIKHFRQSVLAAATSGRLTEEWREQFPENVDGTSIANQIHFSHEAAGGHKAGNAAAPSEDVHDLAENMFPTGWRLATLRDIVLPNRPITYGILKPGPEIEDGVPYVRVADFPSNKLNLATIRKTSHQMDEQFKRSRLRSGDILLSIRGTVGRLIVIPEELSGANITQDSARLSVQPFLNRDYVLWFLRSSMAQDRMRDSTKGVAVRGINIGDVRALQIPLPSREEQDEIVRRIEHLFALADRLEARVNAARTRVDTLTPSTLAKAFRGELVPQDPNDEPASVLLERIRAEKKATPTTRSKGRKRCSSHAATNS